MRCQLCGHVFAQKHRIFPGAWGGLYSGENVAWLCPNHHAAVHFLMRYRHSGPLLDGDDQDRLEEYRLDPDLWSFWFGVVEPVVIARMVGEGRWEAGCRPIDLFPAIAEASR